MLEQLLGTSRINRQLVKLAAWSVQEVIKEILEKMKETSDEFGTDLKISSESWSLKTVRMEISKVSKQIISKSLVTGNKYGTIKSHRKLQIGSLKLQIEESGF